MHFEIVAFLWLMHFGPWPWSVLWNVGWPSPLKTSVHWCISPDERTMHLLLKKIFYLSVKHNWVEATFWTSSTFYETTLVLLELYFFFFLILNTKSSVAVSHNISQKCFLSLTSSKVFEQYYLWRKQSGFIFSCAIVASVIPPPRSDLYNDKQCNSSLFDSIWCLLTIALIVKIYASLKV